MTAAQFTPRNPDFETRVRDSFARQAFMTMLGAELTTVAPGHVTITLAHRPDLCQQHGFFHGGVVGTLADNAGGYASFTLFDAADSVLTVEYKLNLMAPAAGEALVVHGHVVRPGRTITVCRSEVSVVVDGAEKPCATMLGTFMTLHGRSDRGA